MIGLVAGALINGMTGLRTDPNRLPAMIAVVMAGITLLVMFGLPMICS